MSDESQIQSEETTPNTRLINLGLLVVLVIVAGVALRLWTSDEEPSGNPAAETLVALPPTATEPPTLAPATDTPGSPESELSTPIEGADSAEPPAETSMADMLLVGARHVQGAEDAPITIVEFSDFK